MMYRHSIRRGLDRLEAEIHRQRDAKIDHIVAAVQEEMSADDIELFCEALARDLRDGPQAEFGAGELAAGERVNQLLALFSGKPR